MAEDRDRKGGFEEMGQTLGEMAGRAAGQAADMAGAMMGAMFQTMGAWWSTPDAERASRSFGEAEDRACREHFERTTRGVATATTATTDYERARPLYQFGHVAARNPQYQGKGFDEIEAELQRAWEEAAREGFGDWSEAREYVNYGYTHRTPGAPNPI